MILLLLQEAAPGADPISALVQLIAPVLDAAGLVAGLPPVWVVVAQVLALFGRRVARRREVAPAK